jgi:predicted TIM-barrel enzyme
MPATTGSRATRRRRSSSCDKLNLTESEEGSVLRYLIEGGDLVDPAGEASSRPGMAYRNMTAMIYRPAGLNALQRRAKAAGEKARDGMSESELEFLRVAERTTADLLRLGIVEGRTRKAIKADVRVHVDRLAAIMQPSMELAKRYAAAVAEDLA